MVKKIMIVDDKKDVRENVRDFLVDGGDYSTDNGDEIDLYDGINSAHEGYKRGRPDLIISDNDMEYDSAGLEFLKEVSNDYTRDYDSKIPFILMSGKFVESLREKAESGNYTDKDNVEIIETIKKALSYGAHCLPKPFELDKFLNLCEKYLNPNGQHNE
jgi:CheY-like chemotaxis protein